MMPNYSIKYQVTLLKTSGQDRERQGDGWAAATQRLKNYSDLHSEFSPIQRSETGSASESLHVHSQLSEKALFQEMILFSLFTLKVL